MAVLKADAVKKALLKKGFTPVSESKNIPDLHRMAEQTHLSKSEVHKHDIRQNRT